MEQVSDRATLVLASVVYKVKHAHSISASSVRKSHWHSFIHSIQGFSLSWIYVLIVMIQILS